MAINHALITMNRALELARQAEKLGEVPVGAVIMHKGVIIAEAHNQPRGDHDPTAHAEIVAIRRAAQALGQDKLTDCNLWVTLEPCTMCAGAISMARIKRLYYAAADSKGGAVDSGVRFFDQPSCHHKPEVYSGIAAEDSAQMLEAFFKARRYQYFNAQTAPRHRGNCG